MTQDLRKRVIFRHSLLFVLTFITASLTGALLVGHTAGMPDDFALFSSEGFRFYMDMVFWEGVLFAGLLLGFLAVHEFGHYFAAVRHGIRTSLPYFIPFPISPIGTLGAVIRIHSQIRNSRHMFDVGAAGPIAGFLAALMILLFGFATLPGPEYMQHFAGHERLNQYIETHGSFPDEPISVMNTREPDVMVLGNTLLFSVLASFFDNVPPMWELYHYPFLFAGWLGMFFTALNLLPVGQLDGGHILYTLIGYQRHRIVARGFFLVVMMLAGLGAIPLIQTLLTETYFPATVTSWLLWALISLVLVARGFRMEAAWTLGGWLFVLLSDLVLLQIFHTSVFSGFTVWIFWALFIVFLVRIEHPPVLIEEPLSPGRKILGWICMILFLLCISPNPIYFI